MIKSKEIQAPTSFSGAAIVLRDALQGMFDMPTCYSPGREYAYEKAREAAYSNAQIALEATSAMLSAVSDEFVDQYDTDRFESWLKKTDDRPFDPTMNPDQASKWEAWREALSNRPTTAPFGFSKEWCLKMAKLEAEHDSNTSGCDPHVIGQATDEPVVTSNWRFVLKELIDAMRRYEMDVDAHAPEQHRAMMQRAEATLKSGEDDSKLLVEFAEAITSEHDGAMTPTCVFCGCSEIEQEDPEHKTSCAYQKARNILDVYAAPGADYSLYQRPL